MISRSPKRFTRRPAAPARRPKGPLLPAQPSGALISAVIQYADLVKDLGGSQSMMRLSERRRADPVICRALGREAARLADVAVIWNDDQDQLVRVLDAAAGDVLIETSAMTPLGDGAFELTLDAMAYLNASQGRLH